jgi:chemotaxis protein CheD
MSSGFIRRRSMLQFADDGLARVQVRIGEVKIAPDESLLFTIGLGSCVAVALYDGRIRLGGLLHAMLPDPASGRKDAPPGRFATTAVADLVALLIEHGAAASRIRARLAGGASMFRDVLDSDGLRLGRRNVEMARHALDQLNVPIDGEDVYGTYGRSVFFRTTDGRVTVTSVRHDDVIL